MAQIVSITIGNVLRPAGGEGGSVTVINNLTSSSATSALSANQGRVLKSLIDELPSGGDGGDADTLEGQNGAYYLSRPNHTGNIPAANVTESSTKRFTTDAEKSDWNSRVTASELSTAIAALIDGAPGAIDTLNELAAALGDDPNFATTITNLIAAKEALANKATDLTSPDNTKYPTTLAVSAVVDALQVDIDAKADAAATTAALGDKANTADLAAVATSGDYGSLSNRPVYEVLASIPDFTTYPDGSIILIETT